MKTLSLSAVLACCCAAGLSAASENPADAARAPYTLADCPVSGEKLGSMGDPLVKVYDGREVRLCCKGCVKDFEADQAGFMAKIDTMIVADQTPFYPTTTCIVSGEPLFENDEDIATTLVYENRLVRLCCKMCGKKFKVDPAAFIAKLDKAAAEAQRAEYALTTCVVSGGAVTAMGEPAEMILAGRLIRLCCADCEPIVVADPAVYLEKVDAAWHAKGKFTSNADGAAAGHDRH